MTKNASEGWITPKDDEDLSKAYEDADKPRANLDGIYELLVTAASPKLTKNNKPAVEFTFEAQECLNDPADGLTNVFNRVWMTLTIEKSTAFRIKPLATAFDCDPPKNGSFEEVSAFADAAVGKKVFARVEARTYNEKTNNELKRILTEDQAHEQAADFAKRMAAE